MVSQDTLQKIAQVLRKHLSEDARYNVMQELTKVPGNKSFRATVEALYLLLLQREFKYKRPYRRSEVVGKQRAELRQAKKIADNVDGYDRDDLGESPDY